MTPVQHADTVAQRYPQLTALLKDMSFSARQRYATELKNAVRSCGRPDEVDNFNLILNHVEIETHPNKKSR